MEIPNQSHATVTVRAKLAQLRTGLSKLLSLLQTTAKRFIPASAAERTIRLRDRMSKSYRLTNADDIVVFLKSHKRLLPLLDIIPGKIRTVMATEPETVHGIELEYLQDDDGDEALVIRVDANIDNAERNIEVCDILFASVLEPMYYQVDGRIVIWVAMS